MSRRARAAVAVGTLLASTPCAAASAPADVPACDGSPATIVGTSGSDTLEGTPGRDVIAGLGGDDVLTGGSGDDLLCGGRGDDVLSASAGADRVRGGRGDDDVHDVLTGAEGQALVGGPGTDSLTFGWRVEQDGEEVAVTVRTDFGAGVAVLGDTGVSLPARSFRSVEVLFSEGRWEVVGTDGPDRYTAHQYLSVEARTGPGNDVVHGSWHDDVIRGGAGLDTAYPSRGRDACRSVERGPLGECETHL